MKILFLNPHVDAQHKIVDALSSVGVAVLLTSDPEEAWQMLQLHRNSLDLVMVHREIGGDANGGLGFVNRVKADSQTTDLPMIISSSDWGDTEFAEHQATPQGANAYLRWPAKETQLFELIESLFGEPLIKAATPAPKPTSTPTKSRSYQTPPPPARASSDTSSLELVLEDASEIFRRPAPGSEMPEGSDFILEAPDLPMEAQAVQSPALEAPAVEISLNAPETVAQLGAVELSAEAPAAVPEQPVLQQQDAIVLQESVPETQEPIDLPEPVEALSPEEPPQPLDAEPEKSEEQSDGDLVDEMPYLFSRKKDEPRRSEPASPLMSFAQPVGDAVVPGGAAQSPDVETLKKYLLLREQDVAVLSTQLKAAQDQIANLEEQLKEERNHSADLAHTAETQKRKLEEFDKEKQLALDGLQSEIGELRFQMKAKTDKARNLETQVREAADEIERLKDRVRSDIRKIRVREKELENRLEIIKKDSEALIGARETKIIELKRKIDILEFNMDLLQDQYSREKENSGRLREKLARAAQVIRVAGGLLDSSGSGASGGASGTPLEENEPASESVDRSKAS